MPVDVYREYIPMPVYVYREYIPMPVDMQPAGGVQRLMPELKPGVCVCDVVCFVVWCDKLC